MMDFLFCSVKPRELIRNRGSESVWVTQLNVVLFKCEFPLVLHIVSGNRQ